MAVRTATQLPMPVPPIVAMPNPIQASGAIAPISPSQPQIPPA